MTPFNMVREFLIAFGKECPDTPTPMRAQIGALWDRLDDEETVEYREARAGSDMADVAKELADRIYILFGHAATLGLTRFDEIFAEVHRSNMSKLGIDGKPIYRADGKIMKPDGWEPPDLRRFLTESGGRDG